MSSPLLTDRDGRVMILTLNRPEAMNALSAELRRALHHAIADADADASVGAIILTGAGDRAFTAGFDLKEAGTRGTQQQIAEENPVLAIEKCRTPIIVAVHGYCITGGVEIMLACDVVIAARTAKFADTHVRVGLLPGWGLSQRLSRQIGIQRAKEMSLSGNFVDADRAFEIGLINRVVEPADLMPSALALAHEFADGNSAVVQLYKQAIDNGFAMTLTDGLRMEHELSHAYAENLQPGDIAANRLTASERNRAGAG
jgi:enoyl-CoA hydratase